MGEARRGETPAGTAAAAAARPAQADFGAGGSPASGRPRPQGRAALEEPRAGGRRPGQAAIPPLRVAVSRGWLLTGGRAPLEAAPWAEVEAEEPSLVLSGVCLRLHE